MIWHVLTRDMHNVRDVAPSVNRGHERDTSPSDPVMIAGDPNYADVRAWGKVFYCKVRTLRFVSSFYANCSA